MLEILMIRHGKTAGNLKKRYIGRTDEPLCREGILELQHKWQSYPEVVFSSPFRRCLETAEILWPDLPVTVVDDFRECDFGEFENKNYKELTGNLKYQAWIDSNGTMPFPGGESLEVFKERVQRQFQGILDHSIKAGYRSIALAVHGGTIMSIMERWGIPPGEYYRWQVKNGEGFMLQVEENGKTIKIEHTVDLRISLCYDDARVKKS